MGGGLLSMMIDQDVLVRDVLQNIGKTGDILMLS